MRTRALLCQVLLVFAASVLAGEASAQVVPVLAPAGARQDHRACPLASGIDTRASSAPWLWFEGFETSPVGPVGNYEVFAGDACDWQVFESVAAGRQGAEVVAGNAFRVWAENGGYISVMGDFLGVGGGISLAQGRGFGFSATVSASWNQSPNGGGIMVHVDAYNPSTQHLVPLYYLLEHEPNFIVEGPELRWSGTHRRDLWWDFSQALGAEPVGYELAGIELFASTTGSTSHAEQAEAVFDDLWVGPFFLDVLSTHWAYGEIRSCVYAGIVAGYPDGSYQPGNPVTRDQMAVYVSRALAGGDDSVPEFTDTPTFPDVDGEHWALDYVEYTVDQNVVAGYEDGYYHPEYEVTRDQMAVYIARALVAPSGEAGLEDYVPGDPRNFPDVPDTGYGDDGIEPFWAYKHIEYCVENGVVQGYDDGYYHPEYTVTRDQMAVYVARAFGLVP